VGATGERPVTSLVVMRRAAFIAVAVLAACSEREPEFAGVGKYRFTHTTLADAVGGHCDPTELTDGRRGTWCSLMPPYKIGKRAAEVDLYFLGTAKDAPLIEIQLNIRGCDENELDRWMRTNFGAPIEQKGTRAYWQNSYLWAAGFLPNEPGRCRLHFLPRSENAEIARIKAL